MVSLSFATPWTVAYQAPLSMGFPREEYWSGLPFSSLGDLLIPGIKPISPALAGRFFITELPGKPHQWVYVVQLMCHVWLFATPLTAAHLTIFWSQKMSLTILSFTISWSLPKFISIESVMPSNHLILCLPLLCLLSIFPSIRVSSNESALHIRWPKCWSFSFSISPFTISIQGWFPLGLTGLISLLSKGLSRIFSSTMVWKH